MKKLTTEQFIERARKIHGDKYNYDKVVYINSNTHVIIMCSKHGEFEQIPYAHLRGDECRKCSFVKCSRRRIYTTEQFIERAQKIHGNKYDYSKTTYNAIKKKLKIICLIHGEFEQIADNHLNGNGCSNCGKKTIIEKLRKPFKEFVKRAKKFIKINIFIIRKHILIAALKQK